MIFDIFRLKVLTVLKRLGDSNNKVKIVKPNRYLTQRSYGNDAIFVIGHLYPSISNLVIVIIICHWSL